MGNGQGNKKSGKDADDSGSEEDDDDDLVARRNAYVKKVIREAHTAGRLKGIMSGAKNPMAAEQRRTLVKQFFKDLVSIKKCSSCSGYVMSLSHFPCYLSFADDVRKNLTQLPERPFFEDLPKASAREVQISHGTGRISSAELPHSSPAGQEVGYEGKRVDVQWHF
jgi:hypothetical protein